MIGLDPAPRLDGVVHAPELVDVAHEVDVGADGLTHDAHALDGGRHRGLAPALHLHLAKAHVAEARDRKSTRLNSSHGYISYAVFCLKKKKINNASKILGDTDMHA